MPDYQFGRQRQVGESRAHRALETAMPIAEAPRPSVDVTPWQRAIDDHERLQRDNAALRADNARKDRELIACNNEIEGLEAKYKNDVGFYKEQAATAMHERDNFGRVIMKLATTNKSIVEAATMMANLALDSQEIVRSYAKEPEAPESTIVDGMTANLEDTLRNAGVPLKDRLPPHHL